MPLPVLWSFALEEAVSWHWYFIFSPYVTVVLSAVALVLNPRGGGSVCLKLVVGPIKRSLLQILQFFSAPTGFYSQKLLGFIFLVQEPWAGWSGLGLGSLTP